MKILSGIQPSGAIHIGNYFGMIKPLVDLQEKGHVYGFLADYHSMTSLFDAKERKANSIEAATILLACGVDDRTVLFRQSDIPIVTELAWILSTVTPMGLLERCHSYKDKTSKGMPTNHGLFAYPVLMAADILLYQSNLVPVGKDQLQHLEVTRDIAVKFNATYGDVLTLPEPYIQEAVATVPGIDGQKMSKSHGNTIEIFGDEKALKKKMKSIVMDSRGLTDKKPDADKNTAVQLLKLVAPANIAEEYEDELREGHLGYGELKSVLFEYYYTFFSKHRKMYNELKKNPDYVEEVLRNGAYFARQEAERTMDKVRKVVGL